MTRRVKRLRLAAWCACGERVSDTVPATERYRYHRDDPDAVVRWTRCRRPGCPELITITAGAYVHAGERVEPVAAGG